jgi:calcium-dependent protein kinase
MMLSGSRPFHGSWSEVMLKIKVGAPFYPSTFNDLSADALNFVQALLVVKPERRLSATQALEHPWIRHWTQPQQDSLGVALSGAGLLHRLFFPAKGSSHFRQVIVPALACSVNHELRETWRKEFLALDVDNEGVLKPQELQDAMVNRLGFTTPKAVQTLEEVFAKGCNEEIPYSEFLAAAVLEGPTPSGKKEAALKAAFDRFDLDGDGFITIENLRQALGSDSTPGGTNATALIEEVDQTGDGTVSYEEFVDFLRQSHSFSRSRSNSFRGSTATPKGTPSLRGFSSDDAH